MTAEEAKAKTEKNLRESFPIRMECINNKIKQAVKEGKFKVSINSIETDETADLRERGFEVDRYAPIYVISWT
jgi:hypothetical protein